MTSGTTTPTAESDPCPCVGGRFPSTRPPIPTSLVTTVNWRHHDPFPTSITSPNPDAIAGSSNSYAPSWNPIARVAGRSRRVRNSVASPSRDVPNLSPRPWNCRLHLTAAGTRTVRIPVSVPTLPWDPSVPPMSSSAQIDPASPITGSVTEFGIASLPPMKPTATRRQVRGSGNMIFNPSQIFLAMLSIFFPFPFSHLSENTNHLPHFLYPSSSSSPYPFFVPASPHTFFFDKRI